MACTQGYTKRHTGKKEICPTDIVVAQTAMVEIGVNAKADATQCAIGLIHLNVWAESAAE